MVTIEPILFLYVLAAILMGTITTNLLLEKVCREQSYPPSICQNLTAHPSIEVEVQAGVTSTLLYLNLTTSLPGVLFALFLGSWSDRHGRKVPLILPLLGNLVAGVVYVVNASLPHLPSAYIILAGLPVALTGGMATLLMACYAYMADITNTHTRTTRIALLDLGFTLGSPLGLIASDLLYYYWGYLGIYWCGTGIFLLAILYAALRLRDTRGPCTGPGIVPQVPQGSSRGSGVCVDLLNVGNVRQSFQTAFKQREELGRPKVLLLIGAMCLMVMEFGGIGLDYLYTKRMFGWTYNQYVELSVTRLLIQLAVTSVVVPVLSYRLQVGDAVLGMVGCVSKVVGLLLMALAPLPYFLYISCLVSSLGVMPLMVTRAMISKLVPPDELGQIFSVLASFEAAVPLASGPLYTAVYNAALRHFPGAIYLLSTGLYVITGAIFLWVFLNRPRGGTGASSPPSLPPTVHLHADEIPDMF